MVHGAVGEHVPVGPRVVGALASLTLGTLANVRLCQKGIVKYRVFKLLADLILVDFDLGSSAICLILLRQMILQQEWPSTWARLGSIPNLSPGAGFCQAQILLQNLIFDFETCPNNQKVT